LIIVILVTFYLLSKPWGNIEASGNGL